MIAIMEEIAIVVCSSKVHALRARLSPELADHVLGFAIGDEILPGIPLWTQACRRCRGPAQVDFDDIWIRLRWGVCMREQRVLDERQRARNRAAAGSDAPAAR